MDKDLKVMLISYFPLIDTANLTPGETIDQSNPNMVEEMQRRLNASHPSGRAHGVVWSYYPFDVESVDDTTCVIPILMIDGAKEIADHLVKWAENEIDRRFELYMDSLSDGGYAIMLIPSITESIRRWKLARLMFQEEIVDTDNFEVIFSPLGAICPGGETYKQLKSQIANPTFIGFVDTKNIKSDDPLGFDANLVSVVGPIIINEPNEMSKKLFSDMHMEAIRDGEDFHK